MAHGSRGQFWDNGCVEGPRSNRASDGDCAWFEDPNLPSRNASVDGWKLYMEELESYSKECLEAFMELKFYGERLWIEYTATFRSESILFLRSDTLRDWIEHLSDNGVSVQGTTVMEIRKAMIDALDNFIEMPVRAVREGRLRIDHAEQTSSILSLDDETAELGVSVLGRSASVANTFGHDVVNGKLEGLSDRKSTVQRTAALHGSNYSAEDCSLSAISSLFTVVNPNSSGGIPPWFGNESGFLNISQ
ncbi:hypothetical protein FGB62_70g01 [Gracilaria domingensis]|nr:hypothetical protein FGB62_70g01 [Gracilaria domingensis]